MPKLFRMKVLLTIVKDRFIRIIWSKSEIISKWGNNETGWFLNIFINRELLRLESIQLALNFLMLSQKRPRRFRLSKFGLSLKRPFRAFSCLSWDFVWISLSVLVLGEKTLECCLEWVYSENTLKRHEKDWKRFNQGCSRIHEQYII